MEKEPVELKGVDKYWRDYLVAKNRQQGIVNLVFKVIRKGILENLIEKLM